MADILKNIQTNFVLSAEVSNQNKVLQQVFLDGYQLPEERARNAQLTITLADTTYECLGDLETAFADWHQQTRSNQVISYNIFFLFRVISQVICQRRLCS